ncbi:hypothetical protein [Rhizobium leguminosarum]|uniref:hypothetical protein n=1 Tax=Rhizobium leguminosarum TaxID=384 RepID=UPI003F9DC88F
MNSGQPSSRSSACTWLLSAGWAMRTKATCRLPTSSAEQLQPNWENGVHYRKAYRRYRDLYGQLSPLWQ